MRNQASGYIAAVVMLLLAWIGLGTPQDARSLLDAPYTEAHSMQWVDDPALTPQTAMQGQSSPSENRAETVRKKKLRSVRTFLVFYFASVIAVERLPVMARHVPVPSVWMPTASSAVLSKAGFQRLFQKA